MDLAQLDTIQATVLDVIVSQDGDADAVEAALRNLYSGEELTWALNIYAVGLLDVYAEDGPNGEIGGGVRFIRAMAERRRHLLQPTPSRRGWARWRATAS